MIYLISENTLKANSLIADNVDGMYLKSAIEDAQIQHLQPIIGTQLYKRICNDIKDGKLNDDYKLLLDEYITPFLIQQTLSSIVIPLQYKLRNAGAVQNADEHMNAAGMKDAQYLMQYYANQASFYSNRLFEYLIENRNIYKEFATCKKFSDMHSNPYASYRTNINI